MYRFLASNERLATFEESLQDEQIKSYNELLKMGLTEKQIQIRGHDFSKIDRDAKVFLIMLPEELKNSPLSIEEDFHNAYARYLTDKKFIYKVVNAEKIVAHFAGYIGKYSDVWQELELWAVQEDDYLTDHTQIPQQTIRLQRLTMEQLEKMTEARQPFMLRICQ